jgi:hypothetical protein
MDKTNLSSDANRIQEGLWGRIQPRGDRSKERYISNNLTQEQCGSEDEPYTQHASHQWQRVLTRLCDPNYALIHDRRIDAALELQNPITFTGLACR